MPLSDTQIIIIMLVAIIIFLIVVSTAAYFLFFYKKTQKEINQNINNSINKRNAKNKEKEIKTIEGDILLNFDYLYDNIIVAKNNYSLIIECEGINLQTMSEKEKETLFYKYVSLFRNLDTPMQIFVKTNTIQQNFEADFKTILDNSAKELRKDLDRYKQLSNEQATKPETLKKFRENLEKKDLLTKYIKDFSAYTKNISSNTEITTKSYYIIISATEREQYLKNLIDVNLIQKYLQDKAKKIQKHLAKCNIQTHILSKYETCDLLYLIFNENKADKLNEFNESLHAGLFKNYLKTSTK